MKTILIGSPTFASGLVLAACLTTLQAQVPWATEPFSRVGRGEVYGIAEYLHQGDTTYSSPSQLNGAVKLKLDDTGLGGFGAAFHFNDFFAVHADFLLGPATFHVEAPNGASSTYGEDSFIHSGRFNLDWNMINRRLSPFITAGIGYQYMEIDQAHYYSQYGYHHHHYRDYYSETDFTWNVGAGIRWNITDNLMIKLSGGAQWLTYQDAENVTTQIEGLFGIGWSFP